MKTIVKIQSMGLDKLNNAEYSNSLCHGFRAW